jgi:hypothetical protein
MMAEAARLQHRPRRADHRHQHGLPGQEGLQQVGRLGADAGRALALPIVEAVVAACAPRGVPVTLKMRTGWCHSERNAVRWRAPPRRRRGDGHRARPHARAGLQAARPNTTPSPP